ncbi:hypothetical protein SPRG_20538 [Saprolegnia parasitica CBS 223.65]|uniref:Ricin B lectin domain-containing protein n=1 Tax=Saprolegnia parasitica (strain CBS 223.65) TaxID=695850 RepID=A0A067CC60_SAPPC|nr:hypothetical protein SPRG_20538 [Saprolegnia parasitica CBS 223.65]KDO26740.1 hypothetical protein SPRG_20538 [Saprolegnia parasitica CBS 223.65]|eukprot:XP_012202620.1 hypothetical protein SPRG_20538 [Saprolegnia parasitica CBS 223.65]
MLRPLTIAAVLATATAQLQEKRLCTATGLIVSEFYGNLYADVVRSNSNEVFAYNPTDKTLMATSNGECLEAQPFPPRPYLGYGALRTAPCYPSKPMQQWTLQNDRVYIAESKSLPAYCIDAHSIFQPGGNVGVGPCDFEKVTSATLLDCTVAKTKYVALKTLTTGKRLSEYYNSLYANVPANNLNEIFVWDKPNKMFKVATSGKCLDAYRDPKKMYHMHMWDCDVANPNQKWNYDPSTKTLEHATHVGMCLHADPTYYDFRAQIMPCTANNPLQQWTIGPLLA